MDFQVKQMLNATECQELAGITEIAKLDLNVNQVYVLQFALETQTVLKMKNVLQECAFVSIQL